MRHEPVAYRFSAAGAHSASRELGAAVVAAWKRTRPGAKVVPRDVAAQPPAHRAPVADADDPGWRDGHAILDEFLARTWSWSWPVPMYNFSIPGTLKAWIDRIAVSGRTFRHGANGPEGLAGGKRMIIASSRGASTTRTRPVSSSATPRVRFRGLTDTRIVRAEGANPGPEQKARAIGAALARIRTRERIAARPAARVRPRMGAMRRACAVAGMPPAAAAARARPCDRGSARSATCRLRA